MRFQLAELLILAALALGGRATSFPRTSSTTHSWQRRSIAPDDHSIKLHIGLRLKDGGAAAASQLLTISTPGNPSFRRHLSAAEAIDLSKPTVETTRAVEDWLSGHGLLERASLHGDIYEVDADVASAQRLLNTTYHVYTHEIKRIVRTELYHLPEHIVEHVEFVTPTTFFPKPATSEDHLKATQAFAPARPELRPRTTSCGKNDLTSPSCIRQIYDIGYTPRPNRTTFAVYGTEAATYKPADLNTFLSRYGPPGSSGNAHLTVIGDGAPDEKPGIESAFETALDTQTLMGLAYPIPGLLYRSGGVFGPTPGKTYDPFLEFLQALLVSNSSTPSVVSFSESNPESDFDPAYARRLCTMMAQIGTRGTTLLFSTGDNGPSVYDSTSKSVIFQPRFPASCPWVTAVGGTTDLESETAATGGTIPLIDRVSYTASGGGFSNLFEVPAYQRDVTSQYIAGEIPSSYRGIKGFNARGRGYPDVSAFSTNFPVVVDFFTVPIGGTSASTPAWAAVVALLNDYEVGKGRSTLGFLNPWIYNLTSGLKDITTGGNNAGACGFGCGFKTLLGFEVVRGWDAVTGLGSPVFSQLTQALDSLAG